MNDAADLLRDHARALELQAANAGEHVCWARLPAQLRWAIQQEILAGMAHALRQVATALEEQAA